MAFCSAFFFVILSISISFAAEPEACRTSVSSSPAILKTFSDLKIKYLSTSQQHKDYPIPESILKSIQRKGQQADQSLSRIFSSKRFSKFGTGKGLCTEPDFICKNDQSK